MQFSVGGQLQPVTHLSSGKPEHSASAKISKRLVGFEYLTKVARFLGLLGSGGWVIKTRHHIQPAIKPSFGSFSTSSTLSFAFQKFFSNQNRFKMFKLVRISCPVLSSEWKKLIKWATLPASSSYSSPSVWLWAMPLLVTCTPRPSWPARTTVCPRCAWSSPFGPPRTALCIPSATEDTVMAVDMAGSRRSHLTNRRPQDSAARAPVARSSTQVHTEFSHLFDGHASNKVLKLVWNLCVITTFLRRRGRLHSMGYLSQRCCLSLA